VYVSTRSSMLAMPTVQARSGNARCHRASFHAIAYISLLALTLLLTPIPAAAKNGNKTPSAPPPTGTIYFDFQSNDPQHYGVSPDGKQTALLFQHNALQPSSDFFVPSSRIYGSDAMRGRIWLTIADAEYLAANGEVRIVPELFACRLRSNGSLDTIQLTALYPDIFVTSSSFGHKPVSWSNDGKDSFVSFRGRSFGGQTAETNTRDDLDDDLYHIFRLNITGEDIRDAFDYEAHLPFGIEAFITDDIETVLSTSAKRSDTLMSHHWSPDGKTVVYYMEDGLWTADVDELDERGVLHENDGDFDRILHLWPETDVVGPPQWSPVDSRIAFSRSGSIWTIKSDGTGAFVVQQSDNTNAYSLPHWSPDGTYLAMHLRRRKGIDTREFYVARSLASGGSVTILTANINLTPYKLPRGWVSNVGAIDQIR
jgi:hypothetical protein